MRTLKKTLCLVLCLVMMAGLCVIGTSAAEMTDADQIQHKEAVAVLGALGVITGYEDGSYRPTNELTRAEGAAIMTRLLAATVPSGSKSSFTDMGTAEWAQPYVAYCEAMGIIAGYGDGRFGPQDKLTTAQFAKMLLCALGYDATREQMVGNAWEIGVAKLVNAAGLSAKIADFNYGANVTRDAAAQMAFNTLTATMVDYQGNNLTVDANGNLAAPRRSLPNTTYDYRTRAASRDALMQFVENYFPSMKLDNIAGTTNDFGAPVERWFAGKDREDMTYDKTKKVAEAISGTVLKTYTATAGLLTLGTLYTDAKWTGTADPAAAWNVIENGTNLGAVNVPVKNSTTKLNASAGVAGNGYSGATVYLLDTNDDGKGETLVVEYPYLAQVTKITEAAKTTQKTRQATLKVYNKAAGTTVTWETEDFAAKDWILVYPQGSIATTSAGAYTFGTLGADIIKAEKASVVSGNVTKFGTATVPGVGVINISATVNDVAYFKASGALGYNYTDPALNTAAEIYLSNGAAIGWAATTAAASDYVFVLNNDGGVPDAFGNVTTKVGYLKQDGTTETAVLSGTVPTNFTWCRMTPVGTAYSFTAAPAAAGVGANDKFANDATATAATTIGSATPTIGGAITANDKTVILIKTKNVPATYKAYTGISNLPTYTGITAGTKTIYALVPVVNGAATTTASAIYLDLNGMSPTDAKSDPIYLINRNYSAVRKAAGVNYYTYDVIKGGVKTTIESKTDLSAAAAFTHGGTDPDMTYNYGLIIPEFDKDGLLTGQYVPTTAQYALGDAAYITAGDCKFSAGVLTLPGHGSFSVQSDCVAYIYDSTARALMVGDAGDLDGLTGITVSTVAVSNTNAKIKAIFVYK